MPAGRHNIVIEQGATFDMTLTLRDKVTGTPIDLAGHQFRGMVRKKYDDPTPALEFDFTILSPTTLGKVRVTVPAAETAGVTVSRVVDWIYDIESEDAGGFVRRWIEGTAQMKPEATR